MYPDWQFLYWLRSVFWKKHDFVYRDERTGKEVKPGSTPRTLAWVLVVTALAAGTFMGPEWVVKEVPRRLREVGARGLVRG